MSFTPSLNSDKKLEQEFLKSHPGYKIRRSAKFLADFSHPNGAKLIENKNTNNKTITLQARSDYVTEVSVPQPDEEEEIAYAKDKKISIIKFFWTRRFDKEKFIFEEISNQEHLAYFHADDTIKSLLKRDPNKRSYLRVAIIKDSAGVSHASHDYRYVKEIEGFELYDADSVPEWYTQGLEYKDRPLKDSTITPTNSIAEESPSIPIPTTSLHLPIQSTIDPVHQKIGDVYMRKIYTSLEPKDIFEEIYENQNPSVFNFVIAKSILTGEKQEVPTPVQPSSDTSVSVSKEPTKTTKSKRTPEGAWNAMTEAFKLKFNKKHGNPSEQRRNEIIQKMLDDKEKANQSKEQSSTTDNTSISTIDKPSLLPPINTIIPTLPITSPTPMDISSSKPLEDTSPNSLKRKLEQNVHIQHSKVHIQEPDYTIMEDANSKSTLPSILPPTPIIRIANNALTRDLLITKEFFLRGHPNTKKIEEVTALFKECLHSLIGYIYEWGGDIDINGMEDSTLKEFSQKRLTPQLSEILGWIKYFTPLLLTNKDDVLGLFVQYKKDSPKHQTFYGSAQNPSSMNLLINLSNRDYAGSPTAAQKNFEELKLSMSTSTNLEKISMKNPEVALYLMAFFNAFVKVDSTETY